LTDLAIQWSQEQFDDWFVKPAQDVNAYLSDPGYLESTLKFSGQQGQKIEQLLSYLVTNKPLTFEECIQWARMRFEERFNNEIRQLLFTFPKDAVTDSGQPFWSGPKRAPDPITFDSNNVSCSTSRFATAPHRIHHSSPCTYHSLSQLQTSTRSTMGSKEKLTLTCIRKLPTILSFQSSPRSPVSRFR
jgi:hypothetical protein